MIFRTSILFLAGSLLAACVTTQEMPLAPNVVRLDTQASGLLFTSQAVPQTMRRAAQATLARGYTHFRLQDPSMGQGSELGGAVIQSHGSFVTATPIRRPTASNAATVVMFHSNEPGAQGAFDANSVLAQYAQ
jgi:hypothetical protein